MHINIIIALDHLSIDPYFSPELHFISYIETNSRAAEVFLEKVVLKIWQIYRRTTHHTGVISKKLLTLQLIKITLAGVFSLNFLHIFRINTFL